MLDWLRTDHNVLGNVNNLIGLLLFAWALYKGRQSIRVGFIKIRGWSTNLISPDYRLVYRRRKLERIRKEMKYLFHFGHQDEMEIFSQIYSKAMGVVVLLTYGGMILLSGILTFLLWALSVLEKEILHQPLKQVGQSGNHYGLIVSCTLFFGLIMVSITDVSSKAFYLSRKDRIRKLRRLRKARSKLTGELASWGAQAVGSSNPKIQPAARMSI